MLSLIVLLALADPDPSLLDVGDARDKLIILSDGKGHYLALAPRDTTRVVNETYYGDGKTMYLARVFMMSHDSEGDEMLFADPRYVENKRPSLASKDAWKTARVECAARTTQLVEVKGEEAAAVRAKAVFKRQPNAFRAYALSRDDRGIYYYVDKGRWDDNENAFNVYIGPRGSMKPQKLTNVVHDSGGDIFATAGGELRLVTGSHVQWIEGKKKIELLDLPTDDNLLLIYNDLGVYKQQRLGLPCDDL